MYNIITKIKDIKEIDTIIIPIYYNNLLSLRKLKEFGIEKNIEKVLCKKKFLGFYGEIINIQFEHLGEIKDLIFIGLGEKEKITIEKIRRVFGIVEKNIKKIDGKNLLIKLNKDFFSIDFLKEDFLNAVIEGIQLSSYKFNKYLTVEKEKDGKKNIILDVNRVIENNLAKAIINKELELIEIINTVRDLVNEPANIIYPETLAEKSEELGKKYGFEVEVLKEEQIKNLGMNSFLAVAKGSKKEAKFIIMRYLNDKDSKEIIGLVGKGLTYDAGGYSIKSSEGMALMKADMAGAATVIGAMAAVVKDKLKTNLIAVIPACENVISGESYKPGDIIESMSGKTIEIINTDAEGRLTLVDGITYMLRHEGVTEIIDIATLTNTVKIALGKDVAALITNNEKIYNDFQKAIDKTEEKIWRLPNYEDYKKLFKSEIADIKNYGSSYGKVISAGLFIGEFVEEKPWIHLDIAGPAYIEEENEYLKKGATAMGLKTLYEFIKFKENK